MTENLVEQLCAVLEMATTRGFSHPLYLAGLAANGNAFVASFHPDHAEPCEFTVEPTGDMRLPINIMIADASGRACRAVIERGATRFH